MRVYLGASFSRQSEMRAIAERLKLSGVEVTSRWLEETPPPNHNREKFFRECAFLDVEDVKRANMLVRFADDLRGSIVPANLATGARMFETGLAWSLGIPIVVVGGYQNVFDYLPSIIHLKDVDALIRYLSPEEIH